MPIHYDGAAKVLASYEDCWQSQSINSQAKSARTTAGNSTDFARKEQNLQHAVLSIS